MRVVPVHRLDPLRDEARVGQLAFGDTHTPVSKFSPDQVAQTVCMVEEPLLEHLLMQACTVEPGAHAQLDVLD